MESTNSSTAENQLDDNAIADMQFSEDEQSSESNGSELQVGIGIEPNLLVEGQSAQTLTFKLTEPAPVDGLVVRTEITDLDGENDTVPNLEEAQNILDATQTVEEDRLVAEFTIAEGATEASIDFSATEDNVAEGNEPFSLTLLPTDSYAVDINNSVVNSVIADADIVIEGINGGNRLDGTENDDAISTGGANDLISGKEGNDAISGGAGDDTLFGNVGNDSLFGEEDDDRLFGNEGQDTLEGGAGADTLLGGLGNDLLVGGDGDDRLIGVELSGSLPDTNEKDVLIGGAGADTFILGNEAGSFYLNGADRGNEDVAVIQNFNPEEDKIELFGNPEQYRLDSDARAGGSRNNLTLAYDTEFLSFDSVARFENATSSFSLGDPSITFV